MNDPAWQDHHNANYGPEDVPGPDYGSLIERLGKAAGPDRELDKTIADIIVGVERTAIGGDARYTGSLDAALTLVPEGLMTTVTLSHGRALADVKTGSVADPNAKMWSGYCCSKTPALALCIAALKARSDR